MFDDITEKEKENNQGNAGFPPRPEAVGASRPGEEKKRVEDIFSETDRPDGATGYHFDKAQPDPVPYAKARPAASKIVLLKKISMILVIVFALAVFSAAGFWGYEYLAKNFISVGENAGGNEPIESDNSNAQVPAADSPGNIEVPPVINEPIGMDIPPQPDQSNNIAEPPVENNTPASAADTDQDGLSDEEELRFGTRIDSPDSDGDGLFDREEVRVYKTDPLNPDTDGDGFKDGEEVGNGYNPKGAGKLYGDINQ